MRRSFFVVQDEISPQAASSDNAKLSDFDNSMARIHFDPDDADRDLGTPLIPSTHDGDWVADPSPCFPIVNNAFRSVKD